MFRRFYLTCISTEKHVFSHSAFIFRPNIAVNSTGGYGIRGSRPPTLLDLQTPKPYAEKSLFACVCFECEDLQATATSTTTRRARRIRLAQRCLRTCKQHVTAHLHPRPHLTCTSHPHPHPQPHAKSKIALTYGIGLNLHGLGPGHGRRITASHSLLRFQAPLSSIVFVVVASAFCVCKIRASGLREIRIGRRIEFGDDEKASLLRRMVVRCRFGCYLAQRWVCRDSRAWLSFFACQSLA